MNLFYACVTKSRKFHNNIIDRVIELTTKEW